MPVTTPQALRDPPVPAPVAALVALADRCVQCGLCLPHCPTYRLDRHESESPRGRIAYARAVALGTVPATATGDLHLDHCLGCRRCEPVCPAGVRYGELLVAARADRAARRPPGPRERLVLALLRRPAALDGLLGVYRAVHALLPRAWRPLPRPPAGRAPGSGRETAPPASAAATPNAAIPATPPALFVGCVARRYEAPTRAALQRLLVATGESVAMPDGQGCCGAAAAHAGDAAGAAAMATANRAAFGATPVVLCAASGCHGTLAGGLAGVATVEDPLERLARGADALRFRPYAGRVALHLPCTQRSVVGSGPALRRLLARVPGLDLVELADTGCCGAAGLHQVVFPARADAFRAPLLEAFAASGADRLLSANLGCRLHLAAGTTLPVQHPLDFLAGQLA
jgi:glycolate oxidase iron-sulfur subunit